MNSNKFSLESYYWWTETTVLIINIWIQKIFCVNDCFWTATTQLCNIWIEKKCIAIEIIMNNKILRTFVKQLPSTNFLT